MNANTFPIQTTILRYRLHYIELNQMKQKKSKTQAVFRKLQPLADRVLVKRAAKETATASGIILPTMGTKDPNEGEVVAVGPGQMDVTGNLHANTLVAGDKVLLPEYGGTKVKLGDDDEVFMFRESDILGKFE
jgi:chaperonin GroES